MEPPTSETDARLLQRYQNRHPEPFPGSEQEPVHAVDMCDPPPGVVDTSHQQSLPVNQSSATTFNGSTTGSNGPSLHSSRSSSFVNVDPSTAFIDQNQNSETNVLRTALAEKDKQLNTTLSKLHSLHGHYTQIHEAYNKLVEESKPANRNQDLYKQVSQLQTALAVAVHEKTSIQIEVRNATAHAKALEVELELFRKQNGPGGPNHEYQLRNLMEENKKLADRVASQAASLAQQRKECSDLEAKIVVVNQDKNDVQARLRFVYQEKEELQKTIEQLRHDLSMKDIYIRQFSKSSSELQSQQTIEGLTVEKKQLETQAVQLSQMLDQQKEEALASKNYFDLCIAQAREQVKNLENQAVALRQQKQDAESARCYLEEELAMFRKQNQQNLEQPHDVEVEAEAPPAQEFIDRVDLEAARNSVQQLELRLQEQAALVSALNQSIEAKDIRLSNTSGELEAKAKEVARLRDQIAKSEKITTDVIQLSNQLQNERATVSRAVSQNLELKEQLAELQDKLVEMTNRAMEAESEKQKAQHSLQVTIQDLHNRSEEPIVSTPSPEPPEQGQSLAQSTSCRSVDVQTDNHSHPLCVVSQPVQEVLPSVPVQPVCSPSRSFIDWGVSDLMRILENLDKKDPDRQYQEKEMLADFSNQLSLMLKQHGVLSDSEVSKEEVCITSHSQPSSAQPDHQPSEAVRTSTQSEPVHSTSHNHDNDTECDTCDESEYASEEPRSASDPDGCNDECQSSDSDSDEEKYIVLEQKKRFAENLRRFLNHPQASESDNMKYFRHAFLTLEHNLDQLQEELVQSQELNTQLRQANDKLQYWLTHVESENESIGDFIELYRGQREKIQAKVKEKEAECEKVGNKLAKTKHALSELCSTLVSALSHSESDSVPTSDGCRFHALIQFLTALRDSDEIPANCSQEFSQLITEAPFEESMHCSECRGAMKHV